MQRERESVEPVAIGRNAVTCVRQWNDELLRQCRQQQQRRDGDPYVSRYDGDRKSERRNGGERQRLGTDHIEHRRQCHHHRGGGARRRDDEDLHSQRQLSCSVLVHLFAVAARFVEYRRGRRVLQHHGNHTGWLSGRCNIVSALGQCQWHHAQRRNDNRPAAH